MLDIKNNLDFIKSYKTPTNTKIYNRHSLPVPIDQTFYVKTKEIQQIRELLTLHTQNLKNHFTQIH